MGCTRRRSCGWDTVGVEERPSWTTTTWNLQGSKATDLDRVQLVALDLLHCRSAGEPLFLVGRDTFLDDMLSAAGAPAPIELIEGSGPELT